ncbi:putative ATPase AAA [Paratrimastix pyriformis]|uniref:ATPase AAA n=1 Tax=Paratrimastix pyriformis TaxID=342808 RepID=A0ABQ8U4H1_9EUKA|nr:putative ATPase AAA [Paratrimastix pyriformis]
MWLAIDSTSRVWIGPVVGSLWLEIPEIPGCEGLQAPARALSEVMLAALRYRPLLVDGLHIRPPMGLLLHGPSGTGKSTLVHRVAAHWGCPLLACDPSLLGEGADMGTAEGHLRALFDQARKSPRPAVILLDDLDQYCPPRMEASLGAVRLVAQLLTLMDGIAPATDAFFVVATARNPGGIDIALRRPGRFDREIALTAPGPHQRALILGSLLRPVRPIASDDQAGDLEPSTAGPTAPSAEGNPAISLSDTDLLEAFASQCVGFTPADLAALARLVPARLCVRHLLHALSRVTPSLARGQGLIVDVPTTTWADIGGLEPVKQRLREAVEWPMLSVLPSPRVFLTEVTPP